VLVERVLLARRPEIESQGLTLRARLAVAPTVGDPWLAERLITNLVDNAMRHNVPNGWLEVVTAVEHGRSALTVTNTGDVIPEDAVERLFQPFQRLGTGRTTKAEGLGLGLSIVEAIASAHGGTVQARPQPDGGLSIKVVLPVHVPVTPVRSHAAIPVA
jgi:signal transduction histidine kinase